MAIAAMVFAGTLTVNATAAQSISTSLRSIVCNDNGIIGSR